MRTRILAVLGSLALIVAASAAAQPEHGKDKDHDKDHGKPAASASASATPAVSASAGHDDDKDKDKGDKDKGDKDKGDKDKGHGPFAGIDESEAQRGRRVGHHKEQHDKVLAALKGKVNALSKEQRDFIAHHNKVVARLQWIRAWAENEKKPEVASRAEAALAKEDARFNTKLNDLASKAGGK